MREQQQGIHLGSTRALLCACSRVLSSVFRSGCHIFKFLRRSADGRQSFDTLSVKNTVFKFLRRRVFFRVNKEIEMYIEIIKKASRTILLTARPWAERGSWFTRGLFLTARPWAERSSCFTRVFLTARPWAERGSCFTRVFFFRRFFSDQSQTSLGQTSNDATHRVYSCKEYTANL